MWREFLAAVMGHEREISFIWEKGAGRESGGGGRKAGGGRTGAGREREGSGREREGSGRGAGRGQDGREGRRCTFGSCPRCDPRLN